MAATLSILRNQFQFRPKPSEVVRRPTGVNFGDFLRRNINFLAHRSSLVRHGGLLLFVSRQKVKIIDHDANRAKMMRLLPQPEKAFRINHSPYRFAMTQNRHCEEGGTNDEAISSAQQPLPFHRDCFSG